MDSSSKVSGAQAELEYLAALLALREGVVDSADLSDAVTALVDGSAITLFESLIAKSKLSPDQFRSFVEQARASNELLAAKSRLAAIKRRGRASAEPSIVFEDDPPATAIIERPRSLSASSDAMPMDVEWSSDAPSTHASSAFASTANSSSNSNSSRQKAAWVAPEQLDPTASFVTEMPEEDFEWRPTSEFLSHFYLIEDTIRSFTGGLLGITSAIGLMICMGLATWGIVQSGVLDELFVTPEQTVAVAETQAPIEKPQPLEITLPIARMDSLLDGADVEEANADLDGADLASMDQGGQDATTSSVDLAATEFSEEGVDGGLLDGGLIDGQSAAESERPESWRIDRLIEIENQLALANQDLNRSDFTMAFSRIGKLKQERQATLDLTIDTRWLMLGASLLMEKKDEGYLDAAVEWLGPLFESDNDLARLLVAQWLMLAQPEQVDKLRQYVVQRGGEPSADMINWLFAANGKDLADTVNALKARLQEPSADPLNHLFLSVANYNQGSRQPALNALREFSPYLKQTSYWVDIDRNPESVWIRSSAVRSINTAGIDLKRKLDLAASR